MFRGLSFADRLSRFTDPAGETRRRTILSAVILSLLTIGPSILRAQDVDYTGSVQVSEGPYVFDADTRSFYWFHGLRVAEDRWSASVSVPLIRQTTPWISYAGPGGIPTGGRYHDSLSVRPEHGGSNGGGGPGTGGGGYGGGQQRWALPDSGSYAEWGLGDPSLQASYELLEGWGRRPALEVTAGVKPPLADLDRGFGTGAWDLNVGVSASEQFGRTFLFADLGWWRLGDLPELELRDAISYGLGVGRPVRAASRWAVLASFSGQTRIIEEADPPRQLFGGLTYWSERNWGLSGMIGAGLTEATADWSISVGYRLRLTRSPNPTTRMLISHRNDIDP